MEKRTDNGILAENLVFSALSNMIKYSGKINYWRTLSKAEVDFILTLGNENIPIEVKFSEIKKPSISRSFRSFISKYQPDRGIIITKNKWAEIKIGRTKIKFIPICYV